MTFLPGAAAPGTAGLQGLLRMQRWGWWCADSCVWAEHLQCLEVLAADKRGFGTLSGFYAEGCLSDFCSKPQKVEGS